MLFVIAAAAVLIAGALVLLFAPYSWTEFGVVLTIVGVVACAFVAISIPANRMAAHAEIEAISALRSTADSARSAGDGIEGAAFRIKIAEANQWIAKAKYYSAAFEPWWPAEVESLEPIQ